MAIPVAIPIAMAAASMMANASSNDRAHSANANAQDTLKGTEGYADQMRNEGLQVLEQMLLANRGLYGSPEEAAAALADARTKVDSVNPYEAGQFTDDIYGKSVDDFYDKALGIRMDAANDAINQSQALGGNLFSSDTADKLVAQAQVMGSQAFRDATQAYNADKSLAQGIWQGNEVAKQAAANSAANLAQMQYGMASDTAGNLAEGQNAFYNGLLGLNDDYWQNKTDYAAQLAALQAQDPGERSWYQKVLDPFGLF